MSDSLEHPLPDPVHHVLWDAPVVASAFLYQATAHAIATAGYNAVAAQQQIQILAQAVATACVADLIAEPQVPVAEPQSQPKENA